MSTPRKCLTQVSLGVMPFRRATFWEARLVSRMMEQTSRVPQNGKGVLPAGPGGFGGVAPVPGVPAEQVADFQHGFFLPGLHGQPALTDDPAGFLQYHGPQAEACNRT